MTRNFVGSPHTDARDTRHQYAVSLGAFEGGELCVESAGGVTISVVDTRGRCAKVDGRHVHWVRSHAGGERYSLIFYSTVGDPAPIGLSVDTEWRPSGVNGDAGLAALSLNDAPADAKTARV